MSATHDHDSTPTASIQLYLAFELGWTSWNLAFTTGMAQKPRLRTIEVRPWDWTNRGPPLWYDDSLGLTTANGRNS